MRYSIELRNKWLWILGLWINGYRFLSFAKNMGTHLSNELFKQ